MNYQAFSNLQFRPLLKSSCHNVHIDFRHRSGDQLPPVSVGVTSLFLLFRQASNIHFYSKGYYKKIASKPVKIPFYRVIPRQRGWGFSELAQVIGKAATPFLRKGNFPLWKRLGADLMEFAVPEIADVVGGRKNFNTAAKSVERQTPRKQLGCGCKQWSASRVFPAKFAKQISQSWRDVFRNFSHQSWQTIFGTNVLRLFLGNLEENLSWWQCLVVPRTKNLSYYLTQGKLHRVRISNGSEKLRWLETDEFGFETVKGRGDDTYNTKEV